MLRRKEAITLLLRLTTQSEKRQTVFLGFRSNYSSTKHEYCCDMKGVAYKEIGVLWLLLNTAKTSKDETSYL